MPFNNPALWRMTKFYSLNYPITNVAATQGTKQVQIDLKKYLTGDTDFLARMIVRVHGNITVAGAGPGTATGNDNPLGLLVQANLSTSPIKANCAPINNVSSRGLSVDAMFNSGDPTLSVFQGGYVAVTDAAGVKAIDQYYELNFKRSEAVALEGVDYSLALAQYRTAVMQLVFGGRDQLFSGGVNTWDLSALSVDIYADIDQAIQPKYIHAWELFEQNFPITASTTDFKIDTLPSGFVYTDLFFISEEANIPADGIINNIAIFNGAQTWLAKGEGNARGFAYAFTMRNDRALNMPISSGANIVAPSGVYGLPMRDGMFSRCFDARYAPLTISLDVTAGAATNLRLVGRRMLPGGVYIRPDIAAQAAQFAKQNVGG